ncbi:MAG: tol-pal system protein YbgF, partial [Methylococcales bacterium]|nr:tol-pal system protein YbgF [Methylococcales bacterium]
AAKKPIVKPVVKAAAKKPVVKSVTRGSAANQRTVKKAKIVPASKGEKKTYRVAYLSLRAKKVDAAIAGFNKVIKTYPKGPLADNSQYWLGEALLLKGKKEKAMQAFDKVVANYPTSDKVPGALLKLGLVQLSLNNRPKAKEYLDYIIINYPKTRAAKIASKRAGKAKL